MQANLRSKLSEAAETNCAGPARCEHRRIERGAGASVFGYFWGNAKSDWPRAAMERAGGMRSWFDRLTTNGSMLFW